MAKADSAKRAAGTGTPRGKGTYVFQACNVCRHKKSKCDGQRPVCMACVDDGRQDECGYSGEPARGPRTEAHFEAMRKRADALREYANLLESMLEKCRREHGGAWEDIQSYLQFRPIDADGIILPDEMSVDNEDCSNDNDAVQALCLPTESLKLEDGGGLLFHGNTAVFRFAPQPVNQPLSRFPAIAEDPGASYVLLVDGVDLTHYNPDFDWSRHLPAAVPLDRRAHDQILDLTFRFFTSWCLRVFPALFLRDMHRALSVSRSQTPPKTAHYSPMLHNALLALGSGFSDDPQIRDLKARQYFASAAKSYLETECASPNLSVVQALSIIGSFHSSQGEQSLGYLFFGMSARMSQALGLGVDCSTWVRAGLISEHDMLDRDWAYWTTFTQDVCWSLYVGRDFGIQPPFLHIPVPYVDTDFDQIPWHYPQANIPVQPNYLSRTFAATCQLLMIARRIMNVVNRLNNNTNRHEINELVSAIDLELNTWKSNLAPEVNISLQSHKTATPHRLMLHLAYWWLFILLHRPFFHRRGRSGQGNEIDHVKLCRRANDNIMELLGSYQSLYSLRYVPITLVQVTFSAGTVFLLEAVQALGGSRVAKGALEQSVSHLNLCQEYLAEIGKSWQCATNIGEILKNLIQVELKPLMERRSITLGNPVAGVTASRTSSPGSGNRATRRSSRKGRRTASNNPSSSGSILIANPISPDPIPSPPPPIVRAPVPQPLQTTLIEEEPVHPMDLWELSMSTSGLGTEFLAMLGGETLSDAPFMPSFDTSITSSMSPELFPSRNDVDNLSPGSPMPDSDLAFLEGLWNQLFGKV